MYRFPYCAVDACSVSRVGARPSWLSLLALGVCLCLPCVLTAAQAAPEESLSKLTTRIQREKKGLEKLRTEETSVLTVLGRIDRDLDEKNAALKQLNKLIRSHAKKVKATAVAMDQVADRLAAGRKAFLGRARALYKWQRGGSPFVLLAGDVSPLELMRRKRYLEIVLNHDQDLIAGLAGRAAELVGLDQDLAQQRVTLKEERNKAVAVRASVGRERERKKSTLYRVRREKRLRVRALDELEQAAKKLEELIRVATRRASEPTPAVRETPRVGASDPFEAPASIAAVRERWEGFEKGKGKLDLPVQGTIIGGFGRRQHPELRVEVQRHGLDIAAPEGEEIRAVERGEVVFSNRLSGYGRMVIIDHGERYFTVYAHLSQLHKAVGDRVQRGEAIAAVGDSGPSGRPRLYFEVRKDGRPVDPAPWFKDAAVGLKTIKPTRTGPRTRKAQR